MIIIDATNLVVGRMGTFVAKKAIQGTDVRIVNAERAVMTGTPKAIVYRYETKHTKIGSRYDGPFIPTRPDLFLRRTIRCMVPIKKNTGKDAYRRIRAYIGIPRELKDAQFQKIEAAMLSKNIRKYISVGDLCKALGGKWIEMDSERVEPMPNVVQKIDRGLGGVGTKPKTHNPEAKPKTQNPEPKSKSQNPEAKSKIQNLDSKILKEAKK